MVAWHVSRTRCAGCAVVAETEPRDPVGWLCEDCVRPAPVVTDELRQWWHDRYSVDEIRLLAADVWDNL